MIPIFFINLDRRPDLQKSCLDQLGDTPINAVFRYAAKDYLTYSFLPEEIRLFEKSELDRSVREEEMCRFLSHFDLWNLVIERQFPYLVIADDRIVFERGFDSQLPTILSTLPDDSEVVWLGEMQRSEKRELDRLTLSVVRLYPDNNPGCLFYLVTQKGAKGLVEHALQNGVKSTVDSFVKEYLIDRQIHYASRNVLATKGTNE